MCYEQKHLHEYYWRNGIMYTLYTMNFKLSAAQNALEIMDH